MTTMTLETARTLDSRMPTLEDVGTYAALGMAMVIGGPLLLAYAIVPAALLAIVGLSAKTFESIRKGWNRFRRGTGIDLIGVQEHNDPPLSVRFASLVIDATPPGETHVAYVCEPAVTIEPPAPDVVCDATAANAPVPLFKVEMRRKGKWVTEGADMTAEDADTLVRWWQWHGDWDVRVKPMPRRRKGAV